MPIKYNLSDFDNPFEYEKKVKDDLLSLSINVSKLAMLDIDNREQDRKFFEMYLYYKKLKINGIPSYVQ